MRKFNCKEVEGPYGLYYRVKTDYKTARRIKKKADFRKIKCRYYNKKWSRSDDYRKKFFEAYNPPFRCRYCNKALEEHELTVDHIVPVYQAKTNQKARNWLMIQGLQDVNDVNNLVPSCYKCNQRKGSKMGIWVLRGILGKYPWYWKVKKIMYAVLIAITIYLFYWLYQTDYFTRLVETFFRK